MKYIHPDKLSPPPVRPSSSLSRVFFLTCLAYTELGMSRGAGCHVLGVCLTILYDWAVLTFCRCDFPVLKIFGYGDGTVDMDGEAGDVLYASYLTMARAGLVSIEMWDPKSQKWGQPHCQARFAILKVRHVFLILSTKTDRIIVFPRGEGQLLHVGVQ